MEATRKRATQRQLKGLLATESRCPLQGTWTLIFIDNTTLLLS